MLNQCDSALPCFDRALAIDPDLQDAWFGKGAILQALGHPSEALHDFERAEELGHPSAAIGIAECRGTGANR